MTRHAGLVDATRTRGAALPPLELITVLLHVADVSAPLHPNFLVTYEWSERCNAEFAAQGAAEAAMGLLSTPFMHALGTCRSRASQQLVFLDFVIAPLWRTLSDAFPELGESSSVRLCIFGEPSSPSFALAADLAAALPLHRARYADLAEGKSDDAAVDSNWDDIGPPTFSA
jgi:hypothetical protein